MNWRRGLFLALGLMPGVSVRAGDLPADTLRLDFEGSTSIVDDAATQTARIELRHPVGALSARGVSSSASPRLGPPRIQYEAGNSSQRVARVVEDPDRPGNHVLTFEIREANVIPPPGRGGPKARVQLNVYGNRGVRELYQSVRLRLGEGFAVISASPEAFDWLTLSEWWNNAGWTGEANKFRISVDLTNRGPDRQSGLYLRVRATAMPPDGRRWTREVWTATSPIALPAKQWMTVETWVREGDGEHGRFVIAITPDGGARQMAVDVTGFTHHPDDRHPDGYAHVNPLKLYTSQAVIDHARRSAPALSLQWDDLLLQACAAPSDPSAGTDCARAAGAR